MNLIRIKVEDEPECLRELRDAGLRYSDLKDECAKKNKAAA